MTEPAVELTDEYLAERAMLEELDRAEAAATKGPWLADLDQFNDDDGVEACVSSPEIEMLFTSPTGKGWAESNGSQCLRDATFIALARNHYRELRGIISRLEAEVARLQAKGA